MLTRVRPLLNERFQGSCLSPGLADGQILTKVSLAAFATDAENLNDDSITCLQVDAEQDHLDSAVRKVSADLQELTAKVGREIDLSLGQVFEAHRNIANDRSLRSQMEREISDNLVSAGSAVRIVYRRWEEHFRLMESALANSKGDDLEDVSQRLCRALAGTVAQPFSSLPPDCILVLPNLLPTDTVLLADNPPVAVILEHGSHGSHAALFLREMGIPATVAGPNLRHRLDGDVPVRALVDANAGTVILHPDEATIAEFACKLQLADEQRRGAIRNAGRPALTRDGRRIMVMANVGNAKDCARAIANGADGIGLYRTEHIYLGRSSPPNIDELITEMQRTLKPAKGLPICVRLLDAGADKQLPFLSYPAEANPALGMRGIRLLRAYPHLLETGLRAMLALSREFPLSILIPMVTLPEDIIAVTSLLDQLCCAEGYPRPAVGAMIETPAAALMADSLKPHLDFISFGTNDLAQYCFAADRNSTDVEAYFQDGHEAVFRLLRCARQAAPDLPAAICGELAGRTHHLDKLIAMGITKLSVAAPAIPRIKEAVRTIG